MTATAEHVDLFAALGDPTRRAVLNVLAARGEASATTIASQLPVSRPAVVKHLGVLDRAGLLEERRLTALKRLAESS